MGKKQAFSLIKGYTFSFKDEGKDIQAWFSALTGLERVYINGELVSSQRNLSTDSTNKFSIGYNEYSTNMRVENIFKGPFVCTLSKNGKEYKRQKLIFPKLRSKSKKISIFTRFLFFIVLGGLFGFASSYWQFPKESLYFFIATVFVVIYLYYRSDYKDLKPIIKNEEII
ncbi:MAG: hypothetical protein ACRBBR_07470 [Cellvibrionaceae bacterium]